ncbi:LysR substrate-binding domain-containing protein [Labrys portucalensis]|uniref:LysR substrate-binding domain-containing protein n=1 Tax=Labrys neptuniae TaxID=376174 RepID=A0ABV6ZAN8_9HYPH
MRLVNFDIDVLRSFVTGIELGSYARAADHLSRSTSAVSAQLKKLEEQAGTALFRRAGRGLALTEAGETLLTYARRLLALNDEAVSALSGADLAGYVRFGVQEDLGETLLPQILGRFARAHPRTRIETRLARNADLLKRIASAELDLAIAWGDQTRQAPAAMAGEHLADIAMRWIGLRDGLSGQRFGDRLTKRDEPLPLVMFEAPCLFRSVATEVLDRAGIAWRIAVTSTSLAGLWAAISSGLGVTLRTEIGLPSHLAVLGEESGLPARLPTLPLLLHRTQAQHNAATDRLSEIMRESLTQPLLPKKIA